MAETTIYLKKGTSPEIIQRAEQILNQLEGTERVLIDTSDGEIKLEYNGDVLAENKIISVLTEQGLL